MQLRARLALPPGPARDTELPRALAAVQLFNTERAAAQALLLEALPRLPRFDAEAQRALLAAAHALAPEAASLGTFNCPGEVAPQVMEKIRAKNPPPPWIDSAPAAAGHPDAQDLENLRRVVGRLALPWDQP